MQNSRIDERYVNAVVIFSGVFDPVHNGHISISEHVHSLGARKVIFLPEKIPQHKHGATSFRHRFAMLQKALSDYTYMEVLESPYDKHTITETLPWVQSLYAKDQRFILLFGADVASYISQWAQINRLQDYNVGLITFAQRTGYKILKPDIKNVDIDNIQHDNQGISSSQIRLHINDHRKDVPEPVMSYIKKEKLY